MQRKERFPQMDGPKTVPLCECHGQTMKWSRDTRSDRANGYWRCRIKANAATARYRRTPKGDATRRRYERSAKGKANQHRYDISEKGLARKRRARERMTWRQKHLDQLRVRRYKALQRRAARHEREERSG